MLAVRTFHTLTVLSFDDDASRSHAPFECIGSHASDVIHCLWPLSGLHTSLPVRGFHTRISPSLSAEAKREPSGDQAVHSTWCLWPRHVYLGVDVLTSQNRTVASPPPEASRSPSGEKETCRTASVCPGNVSVHRATGSTLNNESGWYLMGRTTSVDSFCASTASRSFASSSSSLTKKAYGVRSSFSSNSFTSSSICPCVVSSGMSSCGPVASPSIV